MLQVYLVSDSLRIEAVQYTIFSDVDGRISPRIADSAMLEGAIGWIHEQHHL